MILLLKRIKSQTQGLGSLIMKVLWSLIYYKIEGNYFKGKIWVLYKSKTDSSGKGYSFEIIVLLISVTTLTSGISTHTTTNVSLTLVWQFEYEGYPYKISYQQISLHQTSLGGNTVICFSILPLWPSTLKIKNPNVILTKFETRFTDLLRLQHVET